MIERDAGAWQIVEQGLQPLVIERQPMLHTDIAAASADRFVKRVIGPSGAELLAVALTEAANRVVVEQDLADWPQRRLACAAGRTLAQRIESADALQGVAEKVEPQRLGRPG